MREQQHTEIDRWGEDEFPFDLFEPGVRDALHDILPNGYWLARDYSADDEVAIVLMRWDDE